MICSAVIGLYAAKSLVHLSMVAVVTHASQFNGVGLRTALDEGMPLRAFHDMREADAWITSVGGASPGPKSLGALAVREA